MGAIQNALGSAIGSVENAIVKGRAINEISEQTEISKNAAKKAKENIQTQHKLEVAQGYNKKLEENYDQEIENAKKEMSKDRFGRLPQDEIYNKAMDRVSNFLKSKSMKLQRKYLSGKMTYEDFVNEKNKQDIQEIKKKNKDLLADEYFFNGGNE